MCPHGYHHNGFMATPALGTQEVCLHIVWKDCIVKPSNVLFYILCITLSYYHYETVLTLYERSIPDEPFTNYSKNTF